MATLTQNPAHNWWTDKDYFERYALGLGKKLHKKPEACLQIAFFRWLEAQHPELAAVAFASAGGMRTNITTATEMAHMGYKRGTPDVMILAPRGRYHGLVLELKSETGRASPEQKAVLAELVNRGYLAVCVKGWEALLHAVKTYLAEAPEHGN